MDSNSGSSHRLGFPLSPGPTAAEAHPILATGGRGRRPTSLASAQWIRAFRRSLNWRLLDLAEAFGCGPTAACHWERGYHQPGGRLRRLLTLLERDVLAHPEVAREPDLGRRRLRLGGVPLRRRATAKQLIR